MNNKSNYYYPQDILDDKFNHCSCRNAKKPNTYSMNQQPNSFNELNIYPNIYAQSNSYSGEQNYAEQQQQYGQNYNEQTQQNGQNNYAQNDWQEQQNTQIYPQNQNQQKQKNMFGSLNPEQLMSLLSSKGNLSGILGGLSQSNPQLSMLVNLMQNMPKAKKQGKNVNTQSAPSEEKEKAFVKVKDYYKENQD